MRNTLKLLLMGSCLISFSACNTLSNPGVAIGPKGPEKFKTRRTIIPTNLPDTSPKNPAILFEKLYEASYLAECPNISKAQKKAGLRCGSRDATVAPARSVEMMYAGFAYSELLCDGYFNTIANSNQDIGFGIESAGLLGGLSSAVMGATGVPARSIALVNSGFSATIANMEAYQQHYFFGPDVATVRELIMEGQKSYQAEISVEAKQTLTHYQAISYIKEHQAICQVDSIQAYVNTAVKNQQITFKTDARDDFYAGTALSGIKEVLTNDADGIPHTDDDIIYLYWLVETSTSNTIRKDNISPLLGEGLGEIYITPEGRLKDKTNLVRTELNKLPAPTRRYLQTQALAQNQAAITAIADKKKAEEEAEEKTLLLGKQVTAAEAPTPEETAQKAKQLATPQSPPVMRSIMKSKSQE